MFNLPVEVLAFIIGISTGIILTIVSLFLLKKIRSVAVIMWVSCIALTGLGFVLTFIGLYINLTSYEGLHPARASDVGVYLALGGFIVSISGLLAQVASVIQAEKQMKELRKRRDGK